MKHLSLNPEDIYFFPAIIYENTLDRVEICRICYLASQKQFYK